MSTVSAKKAGATTAGTDSYASLQAGLTAAAGKTFKFEPGSYKSLGTLAVPANTTVFGHGARIYDTATHRTMMTLDSGTRVYGLEVEGVGNASYNASGRGIAVTGGSSSAYKEDIKVVDSYIHGFGAYCIETRWARDMDVDRTRLWHAGYGGLMVSSGINVWADRSHVKDIGPGTSSNAYGIAFTRFSGSLSPDPTSKNSGATRCLVEDVPVWEGLDTHAGEGIVFANNTVKGCLCSINMGTDGSDGHAPIGSKVEGNTVYGTGGDNAIRVYGDYATPGNFSVVAEECHITDNTIFDGGVDDGFTGAIWFGATRGLVVSENTVKNPHAYGIYGYATNDGFSVSNNVVIDPHHSTYAGPTGIILSSGAYHFGTVTGNSIRRVNSGLDTNVGARGIHVDASANADVILGANHTNATNPLLVTNQALVSYMLFGDGDQRFFTYAGTPESNVTANVGSLCMNASNGVLYSKTSGTGNTGWALV